MKRRSTFFLRVACLCLLVFLICLGLRDFAKYSSIDAGNSINGPYLPTEAAVASKTTAEQENVETALKPSTTQKTANTSLTHLAPSFIKAILDPDDTSFSRLECPSPSGDRYSYLRHNRTDRVGSDVHLKYFFALDLHQCAKLLPRLLSSVIETIRFLGPERCALSIVEGRSDDGTFEILQLLHAEMKKMGVRYFFETNDANPWSGERVKILADLRNQALQPLVIDAGQYASDAVVIFLNDVAICIDDILELIHQRLFQNADMICAMDWTYVGRDPTFYDVWIARGMNGDSFFNIPEDANWNSAWNLFWNNENTLQRYNAHKPFQVFSCWNGATVFTAKPLIENKVKFRSPTKHECFQGEPQLFCKDMWLHGYGKIAVAPAINIEYSDEMARQIKDLKGYVSKWVGSDSEDPSMKISWESSPPALVKCMATYANQTWVPWNESLS